MKAPKDSKINNTKAPTSKPFFNKKGEDPFFAKTETPERPFFNIQPKLNIGQPNDKYEQEADAMAENVVQKMESPNTKKSIHEPHEKELQKKEMTISRMPISEREETPQLQTKPIEQQLNQSKGTGQALDKSTKSNMESAFGADFSGVNIHTDSNAAQMNQALNAKAFAHGQDVYFNEGEYDPQSKDGKKLLAHELTHTIQQSKNTVQRVIEPSSDNPLTLRSSAISIEHIIELYISDIPNEYLTQDYSYSRDWIEANRQVIRNELIRRLDLKVQQNRGDHLQWFMTYLEDHVQIPTNSDRQQEINEWLQERLPNAFLTEEEKELTIQLTVDRLNACARAYFFAAQDVKFDLYRVAQEEADLMNAFVEVLLPFSVMGLSHLIGRSLRTLVIRGHINTSLNAIRNATPMIEGAIDTLGQFAKSRLTNIPQEPIQDADSLLDFLANQFNNAVVAMQEKVRRDEFNEIELIGIFTNYDEIRINGVNYYRQELEQLVAQFNAIDQINEENISSFMLPTERMVTANRLVYLQDGSSRRLSVVKRTDYHEGFIMDETTEYEFITFVPDDMRSLAFIRENNPQEVPTSVVSGVPNF